jgi:hypothetical protein
MGNGDAPKDEANCGGVARLWWSKARVDGGE